MIITALDSPYIKLYKKLHPRLETALSALEKMAKTDIAPGRREIDGDKIFANVMTYATDIRENKKFEVHHKYIDIQYVVEGEEIIGNETKNKLTPTDESGEDIEFFEMNGDFDSIRVKSGELLIIFPEEPHAPGIAINEPTTVKKIVFKVLL